MTKINENFQGQTDLVIKVKANPRRTSLPIVQLSFNLFPQDLEFCPPGQVLTFLLDSVAFTMCLNHTGFPAKACLPVLCAVCMCIMAPVIPLDKLYSWWPSTDAGLAIEMNWATMGMRIKKRMFLLHSVDHQIEEEVSINPGGQHSEGWGKLLKGSPAKGAVLF